MNEEHQRKDRRQVMMDNVRENASVQLFPENVENYFRSCEAHGGELAEVVAVIRKEYTLDNP